MTRLLVTGATGQLGGYLLRRLAAPGADVTAWSGSRAGEVFGMPVRPVDLGDANAVAQAFHKARPAVVIHAAAVASVAECYRDPERARRVNTRGSALLAELAAAAGARLLLVSTDLVFDGDRGCYDEQDAPAPLSIYGQTKAQAEAAVLAHPRTAVARVSLLLGPSLTGRASFFDQQVQSLRTGQRITCFADEWRTPLGLDTAAAALIGLAEAGFEGLLHVGGPDRLSRLEMGRRLAEIVGADPGLVVAASRTEAPAAEPRPRDTSLKSAKWRALFPGQSWPSWHTSLAALGPGS
jgi:dTDP-4-dehydrorhamnose reductase